MTVFSNSTWGAVKGGWSPLPGCSREACFLFTARKRDGGMYDQSLHMVLIDMVLMPEVPELTGFSITLSIVLLVAYEGQPEAPRG